jgi:hypothetical protein
MHRQVISISFLFVIARSIDQSGHKHALVEVLMSPSASTLLADAKVIVSNPLFIDHQ